MKANSRKCEKYTEYSGKIKDTQLLVEWHISFCSFLCICISEFFFPSFGFFFSKLVQYFKKILFISINTILIHIRLFIYLLIFI